MNRKKVLIVSAVVVLIVIVGLVIASVRSSNPSAQVENATTLTSSTLETDPSASESSTTGTTAGEALDSEAPDSYAPVADSKLPDTDKALNNLRDLPKAPETMIEPEVAQNFDVDLTDMFADGTTLVPYPQTWTDIDETTAMVVVKMVKPNQDPEYYSALLELVDGEWKLVATVDYEGDIPE
ncbi:hypothetical protein [uncultured Actinomyces sp.]|uniref:Uncharacterized protein n=1 Tax=Gleimia europaea ACS-120-V-Col10b TaxID=883069 RepID=A0A9W5RFE5_9ACTO|nr:hypothetical protein [uncultured Actinomyces sp.]EPD31434.1 hypothetical protein HMPREF9238_01206 [Gleimia europaea ACS-120-V-Col10b]